MKTMESQVLAGHWWLPGEGDVAQPGRLVISPLGDLQLELIGGFDLTIRTPIDGGGYSVGVNQKGTPVILGRVDGTKLITLTNCFTTRSTSHSFFGDGRPTSHQIYAQQALIGIHLNTPDDAVWTSAFVRLENFSSWLSTGAMSHTLVREDAAEARITKVPSETVDVGGWKYSAVAHPRDFKFMATRDELSLKGDLTASFQIEPPQAVSVAGFDNATSAIVDLMTLAAGQPCGVISTVLIHEQPVVQPTGPEQNIIYPREVKLIRRHVHAADPTAPAVATRDFRFTCADQPFSAIVSKWLPLHFRARAGTGAYFGTAYSPPGFTETRLLTLAVAAEALSRGLRANSDAQAPFTPKEFKIFRDQVLGSIDDAARRNWVKERLRFSIEPSFKQRMLGLVSIPSSGAIAALLSDPDAWARDVTAARNGIAHTGGSSSDDQAFELARVTDVVLAIVLIAELGMPSSVQESAASKHAWRY